MIKSFFAHYHTTRMAVVVLSLNERAAKAMGCSLWPHCRRVDKKKDKSIEKEWKKLLKKSHGMNLFAYLSGCCCSCVLQTKYAAHEMNKSSQPHTYTLNPLGCIEIPHLNEKALYFNQSDTR